MILDIDTEITHKLLVMMPREIYHKNKNGFKELRTRHGITKWYNNTWSGSEGSIETYFQKRCDVTNRWNTFDGDVLIIESTNCGFIDSVLYFWDRRHASILDMTDGPKVEVLVNGEIVRHEVVG